MKVFGRRPSRVPGLGMDRRTQNFADCRVVLPQSFHIAHEHCVDLNGIERSPNGSQCLELLSRDGRAGAE